MTDSKIPADGVIEVQPRSGGTVRVVTSRGADCACLDCGLAFHSTGTAASHARAAGHAVACKYETTFTFSPADRLQACGTGHGDP